MAVGRRSTRIRSYRRNTHQLSFHDENINLLIERGPVMGPVLEVTIPSVQEAKLRLVQNGCKIVKDEPGFLRCYVQDPFGLAYTLKS